MSTTLLLDPDDKWNASEAVYSFYVEVIAPEGGVRVLPLLTDKAIIVGRSPRRCRLLLTDKRVSRVHLRVVCTTGRPITVTDLHSANGSMLDGRRLRPGMPMTWLLNQPVFIGRTHLILRYGALGTPTP